MPRPIIGIARTSWSRNAPRFDAANIESGSAIKIERIIPPVSSIPVSGRRPKINFVTGSLLLKLVPSVP